MNSTDKAGPIFIQGIMARSGTNFLGDLLSLHPDCGRSPIAEDFLLAHADKLAQYTAAVHQHYNPAWVVGEDDLFAAIGDGLIQLLGQPPDHCRLVTKTPDSNNLPLFFKLFPQAYLLILIRDGRSVVESGVHSFDTWSYEKATQWWAANARAILDFDQANPGRRYLLVRYEDLYNNTEAEMGRLLQFLALDSGRYDFTAATNLPVRGSSTFRGETEQVHWKPLERTADFQPLQRWNSWTQAQHERFNWVAGSYMRHFGYPLQEYNDRRPFWRIWNRWLDWRWQQSNRK